MRDKNRMFDAILKVDQRGPDECWPWKSWKDEGGYGRIEIDGKAYRAHRVIWCYHFGGIELAGPKDRKNGIFVLHKCDNPSCCNPSHLYLGNHAQNMLDRKERKRGVDLRGARGSTAKLTEDEVREIRFMKRFATCKALALLYEVSNTTIHGVLYGRHYQDIN